MERGWEEGDVELNASAGLRGCWEASDRRSAAESKRALCKESSRARRVRMDTKRAREKGKERRST